MGRGCKRETDRERERGGGGERLYERARVSERDREKRESE